MQFNSIGRSSDFSRAGKSAADEFVRIHAANRRNAPKYGELASNAATRRSEEKIAATKAQTEVARVGITTQGRVESDRIVQTAERKRDKSKRKAGALATAGKLFGTAGSYIGEKRTKRELGSEDSWYDKQIENAQDSYIKYSELLNDDGTLKSTPKSQPESSTGDTTGDTGSDGTGKVADSTDTSGGDGKPTTTKPISSFQATGKKGKFTVADMEKLALNAGFSPQNAKTMAAIGMAESGGRAGIDTVQSGLDPNRTNEFSVGLFQVNAQAHGDKLRKLGYTADDLRDPQKAAQVAKLVYDEVGSFKPWSVYKSGAYSQYLQ